MAKTAAKRPAVPLYLAPAKWAALRRLSATTRIPQAAYLREAVDDLLAKHAKELRRRKPAAK